MSATGYYLIHDTCPDLYDKIIKRIVNQLKKDKTPFTMAEIDSTSAHIRGCKEINATRLDYPRIRKSKACLTCAFKDGDLGRKKSDKLTIINVGRVTT